eukprot:GCRY01003044.1.p1 GENE.GCRY01003044.1~~GCRY01003044.1.p1  ORF type:complete len:802 (-),score=261.54 GCRY01003044.1:417-2822(-)
MRVAIKKGVERFFVEHAKTSRSSCKTCKKTISEGEVRIVHQKPSPFHDGLDNQNHHLHCGIEILQKKQVPYSEIEGLETLESEEFLDFIEVLDDSLDIETVVKDYFCVDLEEYEEKNEELFSLKEEISEVNSKDIAAFLECNGLKLVTPAGKQLSKDRIELKAADLVMNGRLGFCPFCNSDSLTCFSGVKVVCEGYVDEFSRCPYVAPASDCPRYRVKPTDAMRDLVDFEELEEKNLPELPAGVVDMAATKPLSAREQSDAPMLTITEAPEEGSEILQADSESEAECGAGRVVMDPDVPNLPCNVKLNDVNMNTGSNSFYLLQLLFLPTTQEYAVWRRWGRVGAEGGKFRGGENWKFDARSTKLETFSALEEAHAQFTKLYREKTGNLWGRVFSKKVGKSFLIDLATKREVTEDEKSFVEQLSKRLPVQTDPRVAALVGSIFDSKAMLEVLAGWNIDVKKMPLGKLNRTQLSRGFATLREIEDVLCAFYCTGRSQFPPKVEMQLQALSQKFFTMVPHDFGFGTPPIINCFEMLKEKTEILEGLNEIAVAQALMRQNVEASMADPTVHPIDRQYRALGAKITPLEKGLPEDYATIKLISDYISNTLGPLDAPYTVEVAEVFKVEREIESKLYLDSFGNYKNRQLLFHGSRITNFAGILSHGLQIAPPQAPHSGFMFGKGLYFANMASKSVQYCRPSVLRSKGLILVSEVALQAEYEVRTPEYMDVPPAGYHSVHAVGEVRPDPAKRIVLPDNVHVYPAKPAPSSHLRKEVQSCILEDEYVVFRNDQCRMRYLVLLNFHFPQK